MSIKTKLHAFVSGVAFWGMCVLITLFMVGFMLFMFYAFNYMAYAMHRVQFEYNKALFNNPFSYEDLQNCTAGIYSNLREYPDFFVRDNVLGTEILDKKKYYFISKKDNFYCMGKNEGAE